MIPIGLTIAILFCIFFPGMEMAFLSSNKLRFELEKKQGSFSGWILNHFFDHADFFTSALQTGYYLAIASFSILSVELLNPLLYTFTSNTLLVSLSQVLIITSLSLFTGDFLPRSVFRINPNATLNFCAIPLYIIYLALYPLNKAIFLLAHISLSIFGIKKPKHNNKRTYGKVDLDYIIKQSIDESPDETEIEPEVKIFRNALDFSNTRLRDCIVPRTEIVAVEWDEKQNVLLDIFIETGLSKIIVFKENLDNVVGYIHASEMFEKPSDWHTCITQIPVVPDTMTANKLMKLLMQQRKSIAVVVDEFGSLSGLATMEDLVEEIFGEIEDEHDMVSFISKKINENEYIFSGRLEIDKINKQYELDIPESESYSTLAGLILHYHRKFPQVNETITILSFSFKILKVSSTRIDLIKLKVQ